MLSLDQWNNKGYVLVNNILNKNNVLNSSKFLKLSLVNPPLKNLKFPYFSTKLLLMKI